VDDVGYVLYVVEWVVGYGVEVDVLFVWLFDVGVLGVLGVEFDG